MKKFIVGISGATGAIYGIRLLEVLRGVEGVETHLVLTPAGRRTIDLETELTVAQVEALAKPEPDIPLDLQPMIRAIYRRYRYDQTIDYRKPLTPALADEDAAWLAQQLQARAKP